MGEDIDLWGVLKSALGKKKKKTSAKGKYHLSASTLSNALQSISKGTEYGRGRNDW